jgi:hypothetical protein
MLSRSSCKRSSIIHHFYSAQWFSIARRCSVIPHYYSAMLFPYVTVLSHFILLQCPSIPRAKGTQSLIVAIVLSHFPLQKMLSHSLVLQWSVIPCCYSVEPFLIATVCGAAQSFLQARVGGGSRLSRGAQDWVTHAEHAGGRRLTAWSRGVGHLVWSRLLSQNRD